MASERSNQKNYVIFEILGPKNLFFNIHHGKMMTLKFWPLIRGQRSIGGLWEVKSKKWCHFWNPWPKKPIFQYTSPQNDEFEFLTSDQRSEVNWWPLRGQIKKIVPFLNSLTQKTYVSIYIMTKWWLWIFDLWSEVRGHLMASERSEYQFYVLSCYFVL